MRSYRYLIVGGGMTADAAVRGIREVDRNGSIGLFSMEPDPPYDRPPLSKGLWKGKDPKQIWRHTAESDVTMHLGREVQKLDIERKVITDDAHEEYGYERLLLATGGSPRRLSFDAKRDFIYFRTYRDYVALRDLADEKARFLVIGGGFIGAEISAALAMVDREVTMLFPDAGIGGNMFPPDLSAALNQYYLRRGVRICAGGRPSGMSKKQGMFSVTTGDKAELVADAVVAGLGIEPNASLAASAGLRVDDGIVVDRFLRTTDPNIYAAGDVAAFHNPALHHRLRVEHEDNANEMGRQAGRNMAGEIGPYDHLPYFYSDLFDLGYEAVGILDADMETVSDWIDPYRKGVVYYLAGGRVRGVLLWNVWGQVDAARALIAEPGPFAREDLKSRLPAD
jgi:3-phenylpropionate/trans-cinnamate dioxygenase ferredoxin reductase subunit